MGFLIIDDYWDAAREMSKANQDKFIGALCRRYFEQTDESESLPKAIRSTYKSVRSRVDGARADAERKRASKSGQSSESPVDNPRTIHGQSAETLNRVEESGVEKNFQVETFSSETPPSLMKGGESRDGSLYPEDERPVGCVPTIGLSPEETARFIAEARRALA